MRSVFKIFGQVDDHAKAGAGDVAQILRLCIVQSILMCGVAVAFISSEGLAKSFYSKTLSLSEYIPILSRAQSFYSSDRLSELPVVFSIFLSNLLIQVIFLSIILYAVVLKSRFVDDSNDGLGRKIAFFVLLILSLLPNIEMFFGPYGDRRFGSYAIYFLYAFLAPGGNALFYFLIYSRYQFRQSRSQPQINK